MKKPLLLIVGRTASGKDTLAQALYKKGLSQVLSYTTRPRRDGEGDTHIFIQPSQVTNYPNKMAITEINGYVYFATKEDIDRHDIYIVDPIGIAYLLSNPQFIRPYRIVYLDVPCSIRERRFTSRDGSSKQMFQARENAENQQFIKFEQDIDTLSIVYHCRECDTENIINTMANKGWIE